MTAPVQSQSRLARRFARLPTGIKIPSIISVALVPLGLIALFASLDASRTADVERRANLRIAVTESVRKLDTEFATDLAALSSAIRMTEDGVDANQVCARLAAVLGARSAAVSRFALFGPTSTPICASPGFRPPRPIAPVLAAPGIESRIADDALVIEVPGRVGSASAIISYSAKALGDFARPTGYMVPFSLILSNETSELALATHQRPMMRGSETYAVSTGVLDLSLTMTIDDAPFDANEALLTFLPLLMWASAAVIGFIVTDRLLIRPLKSLRAAVAAYVPGQPFAPPTINTPALEIRELGATFGAFAADLMTHQADLALALERQTKLTREVHHRVKNNLQVVASLINLHSRVNRDPSAAEAYCSIQRRVDALAIVHRNHYAEAEEPQGIAVKPLLGELATNLRGSVPQSAEAPVVAVMATAMQVTQDIAVPIAFLVTELAELSMSIDPAAPITIGVEDGDDRARAWLSVASPAFAAGVALEAGLTARYGRVIEGLSRQLRAPLEHDPEIGRYCVSFARMA